MFLNYIIIIPYAPKLEIYFLKSFCEILKFEIDMNPLSWVGDKSKRLLACDIIQMVSDLGIYCSGIWKKI